MVPGAIFSPLGVDSELAMNEAKLESRVSGVREKLKLRKRDYK